MRRSTLFTNVLAVVVVVLIGCVIDTATVTVVGAFGVVTVVTTSVSNSNSNSVWNSDSNSDSNSPTMVAAFKQRIKITGSRCHHSLAASASSSSSTSSSATLPLPSWDELRSLVGKTPVGAALNADAELRERGLGSPHVHNRLRWFADANDAAKNSNNSNNNNNINKNIPDYTLYRDHAGWCPYCQKTMLLIEAKKIPIQIELVNMRSYGDKPQSFLRKVPNGLLPALEDNRSGRVALDSASIMEFLEETYNNNNKSSNNRMVPDRTTQPEHYRRYQMLMGLERELFRWWCTVMFRPETPNPGSNNNPVANLVGKVLGSNSNNDDDDDDDDSYVSPSMRGFLDCLETVDAQLAATKGPYFLDYCCPDDDNNNYNNHNNNYRPTMIDFVYASHVERMLASCAYWKGMNLRNPTDYPNLKHLQRWMDALESHDYYKAFQSDYYTHVKDIPPQYGPSSNGVSRFAKIQEYQSAIEGTGTGTTDRGDAAASSSSASASSWTLPLPDDDFLQPLGRGPPLPLCVLEAAGVVPAVLVDDYNDYESVLSTPSFRSACATMAAWKLCGNGPAVAKFAARGGPNGAKNPRKTFGAELADPYAAADDDLVPVVESALRVIAAAMLAAAGDNESDNNNNAAAAGGDANAVPSDEHARALRAVCETQNRADDAKGRGVRSSLAYLRDRIGVPRDLPLASARYLRAYLNWGIDVLSE